jgi:hypothetical protein
MQFSTCMSLRYNQKINVSVYRSEVAKITFLGHLSVKGKSHKTFKVASSDASGPGNEPLMVFKIVSGPSVCISQFFKTFLSH